MGEHLSRDDTSVASSNFECSICLDMSRDPVVTMCGHLFCWACLHQWITVHSALEECPVCKACVKDKIIPLYGRGKVGFTTPETKTVHDLNVPRRPSAHQSYVTAASMPPAADFEHHQFINHRNRVNRGERYIPSVPAATGFQHQSFTSHQNHVNRVGNSTYSAAAFGLFPALFGYHMITFPEYGSGVYSGTAHNRSYRLPAIGNMTSEQRRLNAQQEFVLYWFLILLASFAILCLLLF
eukprot:c16648_g1_i3 orf=297-1013(+)